MIPTLAGRWQTRLLLLGTAGVVLTLLFALYAAKVPGMAAWKLFVVLGIVLVFGFGWDVIYHLYQGSRWESDWPPAQALLAGNLEGIVAYLAARAWLDVPAGFFAFHYLAVWLSTYLIAQGPLRIFFPRWRYSGGRWL